MISSTSCQLDNIKTIENKYDKNDSSGIDVDKINDKIRNLSSIINKVSFRVGFFTFKASLILSNSGKYLIKLQSYTILI